VRVENHPFKFTKSAAAMQMLNTLSSNSNFVYRMIFSNLWIFTPVLNAICKKGGGELNALLRTTCAFTQMEGSKGINVIPPSAKMAANLRLIPGDTTDSALEYIKKVVNDPEIEVKMLSGNDPSRVSSTNCEGWSRIERAINATWTDAIVSPYLMMACSDSRHWGRISDRVYRFSTMALTKAERDSIHGNDERVPLDTIRRSLEFYTRIIREC
jgi:carboxypeptidase PM20D1